MKLVFDNGPDQSEALRVTPDVARQSLARVPEVAGRVEYEILDGTSEWARVSKDAEVVFIGHHHAAFFEHEWPALRWVQSMSAGVEDLVKKLPAGVQLTNASGVHGDKGGEFILAAVLMLNFHIPSYASEKHERKWVQRFGPPLAGKRVTLLGTGAIGSASVPHLKHLGAVVTGCNRSGQGGPGYDRIVRVEDIDALLPETDFLVSSLPHTPETNGLIDARRLALLPDGAGVSVVGRSRVFDYGALEAELRSGRLGGAVLDVFDEEPVPATSSLWTCPNLIMTPHCSLDDHTVYLQACLEIFEDNLRRYAGGQPLRGLVDRSLQY
jgi:phosphoglycerate dehydrogenase-like enzyme